MNKINNDPTAKKINNDSNIIPNCNSDILGEYIKREGISKGGESPFVIEQIPNSECAYHNFGETGVCALDPQMKYLVKFMKNEKIENSSFSKSDIINTIKKHLGISSESEIWIHKKFLTSTKIPIAEAKAYYDILYKPVGPCNNVSWLRNVEIDHTLRHWEIYSQKLFEKKFAQVPFQMIDFMDTHSELSYLDIKNLKDNKYDAFATILNTDVSSGPGKHWFCIFIDLTHSGTENDPIVLEYFNSSGRFPQDKLLIWMQQKKHNLFKDHKLYLDIQYINKQVLQKSQSECGVWSLIYIKNRLLGRPPNYFEKNKISDDSMMKYRRLLFRCSSS